MGKYNKISRVFYMCMCDILFLVFWNFKIEGINSSLYLSIPSVSLVIHLSIYLCTNHVSLVLVTRNQIYLKDQLKIQILNCEKTVAIFLLKFTLFLRFWNYKTISKVFMFFANEIHQVIITLSLLPIIINFSVECLLHLFLLFSTFHLKIPFSVPPLTVLYSLW